MFKPATLVGPHVILRPLTIEDADALAEIAFDPDLWTNTTSRVGNRAELEQYLQHALDEQTRGSALPYVTIVKDRRQIVGSTRFAAMDQTHRRVEVGWTWIAKPWQRSVVNTEAKYLMLRHAFEVWHCRRVEFKTATFNERSRRALQRIGAKEEGIFRNHMLLADGRNRDSVYYSIIDSEWQDVKKRLEAMLIERT